MRCRVCGGRLGDDHGDDITERICGSVASSKDGDALSHSKDEGDDKSLIRRAVLLVRRASNVFHQTGRDNRPFPGGTPFLLVLNIIFIQSVVALALFFGIVAKFGLTPTGAFSDVKLWTMICFCILIAFSTRYAHFKVKGCLF